MKSISFFLLIFLSICISCVNKDKHQILVTPQIEYDVLINNPDKVMNWWIQNIEGPKREMLVDAICKTALSGQSKISGFVFDTISKKFRHNFPLTSEQLKTLLTQDFIQNINKIRFKEEWRINEKTLQIEKKVNGIAPVIAMYNDSGAFIGNKVLFWIDLDTNKKNKDSEKTLITKRIQYDVFVKSPDSLKDWWVENIEKTDREKLAEIIIKNVSSGKKKIYDFPFNTLLKNNEIQAILHPVKKVILKRNKAPYDNYDTTIVQSLTPDRIVKLRFLEEWSFNPATLAFEKKIIGIAPIIENYSPEGIFRGFTPLFWIYFDEKYPTEDMKM